MWGVDGHTKPNEVLWAPAFGDTLVSALLLLGVRGSTPTGGQRNNKADPEGQEPLKTSQKTGSKSRVELVRLFS